MTHQYRVVDLQGLHLRQREIDGKPEGAPRAAASS